MKRHQTAKYKKRQKKERANRKARQPQTTQQIVQKVYPKAEVVSPARRAFQDA